MEILHVHKILRDAKEAIYKMKVWQLWAKDIADELDKGKSLIGILQEKFETDSKFYEVLIRQCDLFGSLSAALRAAVSIDGWSGIPQEFIEYTNGMKMEDGKFLSIRLKEFASIELPEVDIHHWNGLLRDLSRYSK